ncbi:MAG TPA: hypothetical protein PK926_05830 [Spirochaetota bacterium]|nr:hypothetical protein [Spirochaetota bacterium]HPI87717.1 hypothetical protein [Spirochaetota bacterium]HPR48158.1 hypothetical protein [Spirochaetota bacterium]
MKIRNKIIHYLAFPFLFIAASLLFPCCSEKIETNNVDMDQINYDNSTNYDAIFKEKLQKEKERNDRYKKDNF